MDTEPGVKAAGIYPGESDRYGTVDSLIPRTAHRKRSLDTKTVAWSAVVILLSATGVGVTFTVVNYISELPAEDEEASMDARADVVAALAARDDVQNATGTTESTIQTIPHQAASSPASSDALPVSTTEQASEGPTEASQMMAPPAPAVLCTIGFPKQDLIPEGYPGDGVCDILVLHIKIESGAIVSGKYEEIMERAQKSNRTEYGLDIANDNIVGIFEDTYEPQEAMGLHEAWTNGIRHYGRLYNVISPDTTSRDMGALTRLLTGLRNSQRYWSEDGNEAAYHVFVGMQVLYKHSSEMQDALRGHFQQLIKEGEPSILVFNIVYTRPHKNADVCRSTAPIIYKDPPVADQPTFKHAVEFYIHFLSMVPKHVQIMFSVTPCGRASTFAPGQDVTFGSPCLKSTLDVVKQGLCKDDLTRNIVDPKWHVGISLSEDGSYMVAYETKNTLWRKICRAYVHTSVRSWAILGIGCSPQSGFCGNTELHEGYEFPVWLKNRTGEGMLSTCRQS